MTVLLPSQEIAWVNASKPAELLGKMRVLEVERGKDYSYRKHRLIQVAFLERWAERIGPNASRCLAAVADAASDSHFESSLSDAIFAFVNAIRGRGRATPAVSSNLRAAAIQYGGHIGSKGDPHNVQGELEGSEAFEKAEMAGQCQMIREVIGLPFTTVRLLPEHVTADVRKVAGAIYKDRRWEDMPVLCDALEEAGCDDPYVFAHLRGKCVACEGTAWGIPCYAGFHEPGPHYRGCWVLDLILGKS